MSFQRAHVRHIMNIMKGMFMVVFGIMVVAGAGPIVLAQRTTANIEGTVTDPKGDVVVGAKVTARNVATNLERSVVTNDSGSYSLPFLPIGTYDLTIEAQGFQTEVRRGITLQIEQTARLNIELRVGATTETVEVTAAPPLTDTATPTIGDVIENRRIVELPLNGRNFIQLSLLAPTQCRRMRAATVDLIRPAPATWDLSSMAGGMIRMPI